MNKDTVIQLILRYRIGEGTVVYLVFNFEIYQISIDKTKHLLLFFFPRKERWGLCPLPPAGPVYRVLSAQTPLTRGAADSQPTNP